MVSVLFPPDWPDCHDHHSQGSCAENGQVNRGARPKCPGPETRSSREPERFDSEQKEPRTPKKRRLFLGIGPHFCVTHVISQVLNFGLKPLRLWARNNWLKHH